MKIPLTTDMKEYRRKYRIRNIDRLKEPKICKYCDGSYQICSKLQHNKTKKHIEGLEKYKMKKEIENLTNQINELKVKK